jgi:hypothetical protein
MSTEDRVRAATRARTDLVRQIRPLELPDELPARAHRPRHARRWLSWGAPIGAAALVTALALVLVMLRTAPGQQSAESSAASSVPASVPRYYVTLTDAGTVTYRSTVTHKLVTVSSNARMEALVGDDRTGRMLATISSSENIYDVTAADDDRTFVLEESPVGGRATTWYLLRLTPGAAHPTRLTKLPIAPIDANIYGIALSPDGSKLALMWRTASTATNAVAHLSVYSVPSGATLGTWSTSGTSSKTLTDELNAGATGDGAGLTWVNGDRTVEFPWSNAVPKTEQVRFYDPKTKTTKTETATVEVPVPTFRALDVTAGGNDLLADSRAVAQVVTSRTQTKTASATPCGVTLMSSDGIEVCGSSGSGNGSYQPACPTADPTIASYSATGKLLQVLYRWQAAHCLSANTTVMWTSPDGSTAIASLDLSMKGIKVTAPESSRFGVVSSGHLTVLPPLLAGNYANIAF